MGMTGGLRQVEAREGTQREEGWAADKGEGLGGAWRMESMENIEWGEGDGLMGIVNSPNLYVEVLTPRV